MKRNFANLTDVNESIIEEKHLYIHCSLNLNFTEEFIYFNFVVKTRRI